MNKPIVYINKESIKKDGFASLYLKYYIGDSYIKINVKINIEAKFWNHDKQQLTGGEMRKEKNLQIKEVVGRAAEIILKYQVQKRTLTKELFQKEFSHPSVLLDFYDFMVDQIKQRHDITQDSKDLQLSVVSKMRQVQSKLLIIQFDEEYLKSFEKFWKKKGNKRNTIGKDFRVMRTYTNIAIKKELIEKSPFLYFKHKDEKTYPVYLTKEERQTLIDLYNAKQLPETLHKTLKQFLFSCFTGLRVSDLKAITFQNIENNKLTLKPIKTLNTSSMQIIIPLSKTALELIAESKHKQGIIFTDYVERRLNYYLKDIAKVAGIEKNISMHTGRHTFATLFLKSCKRADGILLLQKLLGHAKLESTLIYTHVLTDDLEIAMNDFD